MTKITITHNKSHVLIQSEEIIGAILDHCSPKIWLQEIENGSKKGNHNNTAQPTDFAGWFMQNPHDPDAVRRLLEEKKLRKLWGERFGKKTELTKGETEKFLTELGLTFELRDRDVDSDLQKNPLIQPNQAKSIIATSAQVIEGFLLPEKKFENHLSHPERDGKKYLAALATKGKRGQIHGGTRQTATWYPIIFARLLIETGELRASQVKQRFMKVPEWSKYEAELLAEIGEINQF